MTEGFKEFIRLMGEASDNQMDANLAQECRDFDGDDPVKFLRDLRDKCVFSGSSGFCVTAISAMLASEPEETTEERDARHKELDKWAGEIVITVQLKIFVIQHEWGKEDPNNPMEAERTTRSWYGYRTIELPCVPISNDVITLDGCRFRVEGPRVFRELDTPVIQVGLEGTRGVVGPKELSDKWALEPQEE